MNQPPTAGAGPLAAASASLAAANPVVAGCLPFPSYLPHSSLLPLYQHPLQRGALMGPPTSCGFYGAAGPPPLVETTSLMAPPLYYHPTTDYFPLTALQHHPDIPPPTPPPGESCSASAAIVAASSSASSASKKRRARTPDLGPAVTSPKRFSSPPNQAVAEVATGIAHPRRFLVQVNHRSW
jgi:hypothetical protein